MPPGPAIRKRPPRAETKRRIMDAAVEVFTIRGIASSSVNDIARAAGLTKGALYSNFGSKDELILAIMEERLLARTTDGIAAFEAQSQLEPALTNLGGMLMSAIHADGTWQHLLVEYCGMARRDESMRQGLQHRRRQGRLAVTRAIERACAAYGLKLQVSPAEFAVTLMALSNGLALEAGMDPESVPDDLFGRVLGLLGAPAP